MKDKYVEDRIYLKIIVDENDQLRLADRKTGKLVAFQRECDVNIQANDHCEDVQTVTFQVHTDSRMITDKIRDYLDSE